MLGKKSAESEGKTLKGKMLPLLLLAVAAMMAFQFTRLDESRKRFILHLVKQLPYLPGRYYA